MNKKSALPQRIGRPSAQKIMAFALLLGFSGMGVGCTLHAQRGSGGDVCQMTRGDELPKQIAVQRSGNQLHLALTRSLESMDGSGGRMYTRAQMSLWVGKGKQAQRVWPLAADHHSSWQETSLRQRHSVPLSILRRVGQHAEWRIRLETVRWPKANHCSQVSRLDVKVQFNPTTRRVLGAQAKGSLSLRYGSTAQPDTLLAQPGKMLQPATPVALTLP